MADKRPGARRGRKPKAAGVPVEHRVKPKMAIAVAAIVEQNASLDAAADAAGLTKDAVYHGLKNPAVRAHLFEALQPLKIIGKVRAMHALLDELSGPNRAARVAAARTLMENDPTIPLDGSFRPQPGITIIIEREAGVHPRVVGPVIDAQPAAVFDRVWPDGNV